MHVKLALKDELFLFQSQLIGLLHRTISSLALHYAPSVPEQDHHNGHRSDQSPDILLDQTLFRHYLIHSFFF
jgi:hypothetical protein